MDIQLASINTEVKGAKVETVEQYEIVKNAIAVIPYIDDMTKDIVIMVTEDAIKDGLDTGYTDMYNSIHKLVRVDGIEDLKEIIIEECEAENTPPELVDKDIKLLDYFKERIIAGMTEDERKHLK